MERGVTAATAAGPKKKRMFSPDGLAILSSTAFKQAVDDGWRRFWSRRGISAGAARDDFGNFGSFFARKQNSPSEATRGQKQ